MTRASGQRSSIPVALSTASAYPEPTEVGFALAAQLGYDGVEVMVGTDASSQDVATVQRMSRQYGVQVLAVHAPCLLITQRVWGPDPLTKLHRSAQMAHAVDAGVVVVHPPFRWQREYARRFEAGVCAVASEHDVRVAVENMFPWRAAGWEMAAYAPHWDTLRGGYEYLTLDVSHTSVSGTDAMAFAEHAQGRLTHVHLADGTGANRDEHLVPGRGSQPCAALLGKLATSAYAGSIVVEVNTRRARDRDERAADLRAALEFARTNLQAGGRQPAPLR